MFSDKLQNRWVINEENATQIRKTVQNTAPDIQTSHTSTRQWAKGQPASHTSMLTVYQPCFYFLSFAFFFPSQKSFKQKRSPVTPLAPSRNEKKRMPIKGLTSGYISRSIHVKCLQSWRNSDTEWILTESVGYTCTWSLQIMASPPSCRFFHFSPEQLRI